MYIDDVYRTTVVVKTINWLHYLNYETADRTLSGSH